MIGLHGFYYSKPSKLDLTNIMGLPSFYYSKHSKLDKPAAQSSQPYLAYNTNVGLPVHPIMGKII